MSSRTRARFLAVVLSSLSIAALPGTAFADAVFSWSGMTIAGEANVDYPGFTPEGTAVFSVSGNTLTVTLTYTGASSTILGVNQSLTGLTWDLDGFSGSLMAQTAVIAPGSTLVGTYSDTYASETDLSGQWAYKDDIESALGDYGVGAVGDINFGEDTFSTSDIIDPSKTFKSPAPNGTDFGLVGKDVNLTSDGFKSQGPFVQNSMVFSFEFSGDLTEDMIRAVQPIFGSDGAPVAVSEPGTLVLLATGLGFLGLGARRRRRRAS